MIEGRYFDSRSSQGHPATLSGSADGSLRLQTQDGERAAALAEVQVSDRIGRVPRRLTFADGGVFETTDNDAIDRLYADHGHEPGFVNWLEQRWPVALGSLAAVALVTVLFLRFGVPAISGWAARVLPPSVDAAIGAQTLQILDKGMLRPSRLPAARQQQLQQLFAGMTRGLDDGHQYQLELRRSRTLGANAVALPAGIIVMTDELVAVATNDEELVAVLAHEIGHVRGRHALRQLLQGAGISAMAVVLVGDLSSVTALASAAPLLLQARNSRDFEREADDFARGWLKDRRIPAHRFDDILCRLARSHGDKGKNPFAYLSTHPAPQDRARCAAPPTEQAPLEPQPATSP